MMDFKNVYEDNIRADSYARLEFPGTRYTTVQVRV